jgi:ABC-type multidrug transport system fused ATPase/permease subunit
MKSYQNIYRLWRHLTPRRQRQFGLLFVLMLISALVEVVSLGSVLPFLGVLAVPDKVFDNSLVAYFSSIFQIHHPYELVLPLTILFALMALMAGLFRILLLWVSTRLVHASGADLSMELYKRTLYQPYQVHIARNSSAVISGMSKVEVALNVMTQLFMLISSLIFLLAIMITLVLITPTVALTSIASFGLSYILIAWFSRKTLLRNSKRIALERNQVIKSIQEGLGGIRDVLLDGTQNIYCDIYRKADAPLRKAQGQNAFISQSPRFAMEAIGMVMIAFLAYILSLGKGGINEAIPTLGVLAVGAQRMMPSLQQVYSAWTNIIGNQASLSDAIDLLEQPMPDHICRQQNIALPFRKMIVLRDICFAYSNDMTSILNNLNLVIKKGSRTGFIGPTGSGKSTLLDVVMGLLQPTNGTLEVDGKEINSVNQRAWQARISHVPQSIFLADSTINENIAFGVPKNKIDYKRVEMVATQSGIAYDIMLMPDQYETFVGERGVRLSGGQRQRIGIARALYKQADVLIFDEATSALDNDKENYVMSSIEALDNQITVLIIAHRLTTLKNCTQIVELSDGHIKKIGTYQDLVMR